MKVHNCINGLKTRLTSTESLYIMNVTGKRAKEIINVIKQDIT